MTISALAKGGATHKTPSCLYIQNCDREENSVWKNDFFKSVNNLVFTVQVDCPFTQLLAFDLDHALELLTLLFLLEGTDYPHCNTYSQHYCTLFTLYFRGNKIYNATLLLELNITVLTCIMAYAVRYQSAFIGSTLDRWERKNWSIDL